MRNKLTSKSATVMTVLAACASLLAAVSARADTAPDFTNPATAISGAAVIASGTCIAKYATSLDDRTKPAQEIAQRIAERCAKEISRSAGLASWMVGKPDEYAKDLKYTSEDLTTNAVLRSRAAASKQHTI